jgi:peptidoglycan LD-endopeptidase LytH
MINSKNPETMGANQELIHTLQHIKDEIKPVVKVNFSQAMVLDLTDRNRELKEIDLSDAAAFSEYVFSRMKEKGSTVAIGRYNEDRTIYKGYSLFEGNKPSRYIHLGIDLWVHAGTLVFAPIAGHVHSFADNKAPGDYGPTIILEHHIGSIHFYTLYGHLSPDSLSGLEEKQPVKAGQEIARVGNYPQNGNWPPHLHFQIITDLQGKKGDFWGVAAAEEREKMLAICPDPNIILQLNIAEAS